MLLRYSIKVDRSTMRIFCKLINFYAFDYQQIKRLGQSFLYFENFYSLILADNNVIYLSLVIIYGNLVKYRAVTTQFFQ